MSHKNRVIKECETCGKSVERPASGMRGKVYCSTPCYHGGEKRAQARASGLSHYSTGLPCVAGHIAERMVSNGRCVVCLRTAKKNWEKTADGKLSTARINAKRRAKTFEARRAYDKMWAEKFKKEHGKSHRSIYHRDRMQRDPEYKLATILRGRFLRYLDGREKSGSVLKMVGCSLSDLRQHLESRFQAGMTWQNHGYGRDKWHVDHKRPLIAFDPNDMAEAWHYSNLQPLWQEQNLRKPRKPELFL